MGQYSLLDLLRGTCVVAAVLLTLVLVYLLPQPGYRLSRAAYFLLVVAVAWVGVAGAVQRRPYALLGSGCGLFLLGFWQFTIGLAVLPTSAVFVVTGVLLWDRAQVDAEDASDAEPPGASDDR